MSEISKELVEQLVDSAQGSAAGPVPATRVRVDYMNLIPKSAWVYSKEQDIVTYDDWENHTLSLMETTQIPKDYRIGIANAP